MSEREPDPHPADGGQRGDGPAGRPIAGLIHNWISLAGLGIAAFIFANLFFLVLLSFSGVQNPYLGILAYLIFPVVTLFALLLVPVGMLRERRRRRTLEPSIPRYPRLDLNTRAGWKALAIIVGSFVFFIVGSTTATYKAYQFTDTVSFCGPTCHTVMKPEYTAYQDSPHARVSCVACHVGPGAAWYVRSKLSGVYQVYAVLSSKYPRPIETPIHSLRPVREACELCHWPKKFYGAQLKIFTHYAYDEHNTPTQIEMLIKTGGGNRELHRATGIHWHMNIANKVWFVSTDKQHQTIPWVKVRSLNGRVTEYLAKNSSLKPQQIDAMPKHLMDCVTCHTRPSHKFRAPDQAVDQAMVAGRLDPSLPFLKRQAVKLLTDTYPSTEKAIEAIATGLDVFYRNRYPNVYAENEPQIKQAIAQVQTIYENNIFPYMKVDWRTHPDNIGHLYYAGCFRCHDGQHVSKDGRTIPKDCNGCHTILSSGATPKTLSAIEGQPFKHPIDLKVIAGMNCNNCHTGASL